MIYLEITKNDYIHAVYHTRRRSLTMKMMESFKTLDIWAIQTDRVRHKTDGVVFLWLELQ